MNLGADDYLTKPVAREDLLAAVKTRLSRKRVHQIEIRAAKSVAGFNPISLPTNRCSRSVSRNVKRKCCSG
jgi:DNA-binding response OmpR family regulator